MKFSVVIPLFATAIYACEDCYASPRDQAHARNVRRMQPDAQGAVAKPRGPLQWGQLNFLHTTDTHGWLEGSATPGTGDETPIHEDAKAAIAT